MKISLQLRPRFNIMKSIILNTLKKFSITLLLLVASQVLIVIVGLLSYPKLPPQVPLFYSRPNGDDQIVDTIYLAYLPISMVLIVLINIYISRFLFSGNVFVRRIIYYANIVIIILITLIFLRIIMLIT